MVIFIILEFINYNIDKMVEFIDEIVTQGTHMVWFSVCIFDLIKLIGVY